MRMEKALSISNVRALPTDEDLNPAAWLDELKIARHPVSCDPVAKEHQPGFVRKIDQHFEGTGWSLL
jgi:hypothetical protein